MATVLDAFADFAAAVTARCPPLSDEARLRYAADLLAEVTAAVEAGSPVLVKPCGRVVRLAVDDVQAAAGSAR